MIYQPKNPVGYRTLITWRQAGDIYHKAKDFTAKYLNRISDSRLIAHINDSARSGQRNIEEGYKRATTKEYVQFLGFSRASIEELKGDFEELKREWKEGIRWVDKGDTRECGKGEFSGGRECGKGEVRAEVARQISELLDLIYGEDCMIGRQIARLEDKMVKEKSLPRSDMVKRCWNKSESGDRKFWDLAESRFGLKRSEKGIVTRVEKGKEGKRGEDKGAGKEGATQIRELEKKGEEIRVTQIRELEKKGEGKSEGKGRDKSIGCEDEWRE